MDLREKPGKLQKILEFILRLRLIFVVLLVVLSVTFVARDWQGMLSLPVAASDEIGEWFYSTESLSLMWESSRFLLVSAVASLVLILVFIGVRGFI